MNKITVNGITVEVPDGANISIIDGTIMVGSTVIQEGLKGIVEVKWEGPAANIDCKANLSVAGNVEGGAQANNNITVGGSVYGNVVAGNNVVCGPVVDGAVKSGNNVECGGDINGDVSADNNVMCGNVGGRVKAGNNVIRR
jgi:hypothetical protein